MSVLVVRQILPLVVESEPEVIVIGQSGPQGPPGLTWRGAYAAGTTYAEDDVVESGGSAYVSLQGSNVGHDPATSPPWWDLLASQGATGEQGQPGTDGETHLFVGSGAPDAGLGEAYDLYVDLGTTPDFEVWQKAPVFPPFFPEPHWVAVMTMMGDRPLTISGEEPGALVDGTLASLLCPQAGSLDDGGGLLGTGPAATCTLTLVRGVDTLLTWTWLTGETVATVTGGPAAVTAGDLLTLVLSGSAGAQNLTYYATGAVS